MTMQRNHICVKLVSNDSILQYSASTIPNIFMSNILYRLLIPTFLLVEYFDICICIQYQGTPSQLSLLAQKQAETQKFLLAKLCFLSTPNTVVVFSNEKPDVKELSKDRWKIFRIRDDDLIDVTDIYVQKYINISNHEFEIMIYLLYLSRLSK